MENNGVDNATTQVHTVALPNYFCFLFCYFSIRFGEINKIFFLYEIFKILYLFLFKYIYIKKEESK